MYRVNYGNGQVSETYRHKTEAERELRRVRAEQYGALAGLERYEFGFADDNGGEWMPAMERA